MKKFLLTVLQVFVGGVVNGVITSQTTGAPLISKGTGVSAVVGGVLAIAKSPLFKDKSPEPKEE